MDVFNLVVMYFLRELKFYVFSFSTLIVEKMCVGTFLYSSLILIHMFINFLEEFLDNKLDSE